MVSRFGQTMSALALVAVEACAPKQPVNSSLFSFQRADEIYVDNTSSCVVSVLYDPKSNMAKADCYTYCGDELRPHVDGFSWNSQVDLGAYDLNELSRARKLCTSAALNLAVSSYRKRHGLEQ